MRQFILLTSLALFFSTSAVYAKRYALVIGNSLYGKEIGDLRNPVNDAQDMAALLKKKGFTVSILTNATQR